MSKIKNLAKAAMIGLGMFAGTDALGQQHGTNQTTEGVKNLIDKSQKQTTSLLSTLEKIPGFTEACHKLRASSQYDNVLGQRVSYSALPTDPVEKAAAEFLQLSFAAPHKLLVQSDKSESELLSLLKPTLGHQISIKKVGGGDVKVNNQEVHLLPRYEIDLGQQDAIDMKKRLEGTAGLQVAYADRIVYSNALMHFNDPLLFANNGVTDQWWVSDSIWNFIAAPGAITKDVDSSYEARLLHKGILQAKGLPAPDIEFVMFDSGLNPTTEFNVAKKFNHFTNNNATTSEFHGNGVGEIAVGVGNNNQNGVGTAEGTPINIQQVATGGAVYINKLYDAIDSSYLRAIQFPDRVFVWNWSFFLGNDPVAHAELTPATSLTKPDGSLRVVVYKSSGNSGPGTIDPSATWPELITIGGTESTDPTKPTAGLASTGPGMKFTSDATSIYTFDGIGNVQTQGTSFATPAAAGDAILSIEQTGGHITADKFMKRQRGGAYDVDAAGYDTQSGYGYTSGYQALSYATCENWPHIDMVDSAAYPLDAQNNVNFTLPFKPQYYNNDVAIIGGNTVSLIRECLYPNGQLVPFTISGGEVTYHPVISPANGFSSVDPANNYLVYRVKQNQPNAHYVITRTKNFSIVNMPVAPVPPPTPQITTALTPQCDIINITMGNAPAVAGGPITVQTLLNGIPAGTFNYATGLASIPTGGATGPKTATIKYVSAGGITQVDTVINVNTDYPSAISQPTVAPNIVGASPCVGTQYTINNNFTGGGPGVQVRLKRNGAVVAIGVAPFNWTATVGTHTFITEILEGPNACNASWQPGPAATITINANPTPAVSVSPNDTVCNTNPVTMTGLGANLNYSYAPAANNGVPFTPPQSATTAYTVTAQSTITGCSAQIVQNITSLANLPNVTAATPSLSLANVCIGGSASITPNPTNAGNNPTYTWFHGATNLGTSSGIPGTFTLPAIVTATAGTKQLHYVVTYGNSPAPACPPATPTATSGNVALTVHAAPVANVTVSPNDSLCQGNQVTFNVTGGTPSISGGVVNNVPFTPLATNTYSITVTDAFGCTGTATQIITVNQNPSVYITTNPLNATICLGNQATMTANGAISYLRSNGLGTGNPKPVSPPSTTTYTVTGTDANGCTNTDTETIIVNGLVNLSGNTWQPIADVCTSANIPFTINIAAGIPAGTVLNVKQEIGGIWTNIGQVTTGVAGPTSVTINASIPMGATAKFTADVANPGQPCAIPGQTDTITVVNNEFPAPVITPNGLHLEIGNLTAGTTQQWQKWDGATFVDMPGAVNPSYNVIANGQYRVESKKGSCVYASNTVVFTNVSVDHVDLEPSIACYPNPLQGSTLFIDNIPLKYHAKAVLHDMAGRTIADEQLTQVNNRAELNLSGVAAGIYILDVYDYKTGDMLKKGVKVVKQ